jgi:hypothetical protein
MFAGPKIARFWSGNQKLRHKSWGHTTLEDEVRVAMIAVLPSVSLGLVACGADPVRRTVTRGLIGAVRVPAWRL